MHTIKDNVQLLTPELLVEINEIIVKAGHGLLGKKKAGEALRGRCDSFVVETDVHCKSSVFTWQVKSVFYTKTYG